MPSKAATPGQSQTYQRFAWMTLALAGMVALFSGDRAEPGGSAGTQSALMADPSSIQRGGAQKSFTQPVTAPLADTESVEGSAAGAAEADDEQAGTAPVLPSDPALADEGPRAPAAGPSSSAEAGQLMASSRNRAGGVDQGDEPIRAPTR